MPVRPGPHAMPRLVSGNRAERQHAPSAVVSPRPDAAAAGRPRSCRRGRCSTAAAARRTRSRGAAAHARDPRIVDGRLHRAGEPLGIDHHRSELVGGEDAAVPADALLREEHRPAVFELDADRDQQRRPARTRSGRRPRPRCRTARLTPHAAATSSITCACAATCRSRANSSAATRARRPSHRARRSIGQAHDRAASAAASPGATSTPQR